jgi:hypothetical protein
MQDSTTEALEDRRAHWREQARQAESMAEQAEHRQEYALAGYWWLIAQGFDQEVEAMDSIEAVFGPVTLASITDQHEED